MDNILNNYLKIQYIKSAYYCFGGSLIMFMLCPNIWTFINIIASALFVHFVGRLNTENSNLSFLIVYLFALYNIMIFPEDSMAILLIFMVLAIQMFKNKLLNRLGKQPVEYIYYCIMFPIWLIALKSDVLPSENILSYPFRQLCSYAGISEISIIKEFFVGFCFFLAIDLVIRTDKLDKIFKKIDTYQSYFDDLTGLMNRRIISEWKNAVNIPMAAFIDIDNFKSINDKYGHDVGDIVLKNVCEILKEYSFDDVIVRSGGEEFVLLVKKLNGRTFTHICIMMDCLRDTVIKVADTELKVTMSIGVAVNKNNCNLDDLIKEADKQCYIAKDKGKNQMILNGRRIY